MAYTRCARTVRTNVDSATDELIYRAMCEKNRGRDSRAATTHSRNQVGTELRSRAICDFTAAAEIMHCHYHTVAGLMSRANALYVS